VQTFAKLSALWNKQNRSTSAAEKIKEAISNLLPTPGDTRWNSVYDAVAKVYDLLLTPEQETKFDKLLDELEIKRLQPVHKTFVAEYVDVMRPVCCALDVLQGQQVVGLGYLLPTISVVKHQLSSITGRSTNTLTVCKPLITALQTGNDKWFGPMFADVNAQLAAVFTQCLNWTGLTMS